VRKDVDTHIRTELTEFIVTNYLFGDVTRTPQDDDALVEDGVIDSTGILELIDFLEDHFGITVSDAETVPRNLGSIANLTKFIASKLPGAGQHVRVAAQEPGTEQLPRQVPA